MGWGTTLYTDIYFSREKFDSLHEVKEAIQEQKNTLEFAKKRLTQLATVTDLKQIIPDEDTDPLSYVANEVNNLVELITDADTQLYKLYLLEETWKETHDDEDNIIEPIEHPQSMLYTDY